MKMTVTTSYELTFQVQAHWSEEGGMGSDYFGESVNTI